MTGLLLFLVGREVVRNMWKYKVSSFFAKKTGQTYMQCMHVDNDAGMRVGKMTFSMIFVEVF